MVIDELSTTSCCKQCSSSRPFPSLLPQDFPGLLDPEVMTSCEATQRKTEGNRSAISKVIRIPCICSGIGEDKLLAPSPRGDFRVRKTGNCLRSKHDLVDTSQREQRPWATKCFPKHAQHGAEASPAGNAKFAPRSWGAAWPLEQGHYGDSSNVGEWGSLDNPRSATDLPRLEIRRESPLHLSAG